MRKSKKQRVIAYWLIPAKDERDLFRTIIGILAKELKAPFFEPHLTLFWTKGSVHSARQLLKQIGAAPLQLSIRDVRSSAKFTKTLFVRFRPNAALNRLVANTQRAAGERRVKIPEPHLSLCYKQLSASTRQELASMIRLPLQRVRFDSLQAVRCALPTQTSSEVRAWRMVARKRLTE